MSPLAGIGNAYGPRFTEFAFEPAFTAAVDQHVAELRERTTRSVSCCRSSAPVTEKGFSMAQLALEPFPLRTPTP
jgi:hypothetical protein